MKKLNYYPLFMFALVTFMLGCKEFIDEYESTWEYAYEQKVEKSLVSPEKQNLIFLNFEFGMSPASYAYHRTKLLKQGIFRPTELDESSKFTEMKIDSSKIEYILQLPSGNFSVLLFPTFDEEKLVQLRLQVLPLIIGRDFKKLYAEIFQVYKTKYGEDFLEKKQIMAPNEFFWLKSNKQIKLKQSMLAVEVIYSDLDWFDISEEASDNNLLDSSKLDSKESYEFL